MVDKADNPINTGIHAGCVDDALVSMDLSEEERSKLLQVMAKAKEFDSTNQASPLPQFSSQELEGQLLKHTNVMRGWQPRYFRLDPKQAVLSYYISEDKKHNPPRGFLHLWGAVISPSDEDSQTFSISGANSEVFRLKAPDAKERQKWITHLRAAVSRVSNHHTETPHDTSPVNTPMTSLTPAAPAAAGTTGDDDQMEHLALQRTPSKRTSLTRLFKTTKNTINRPPRVSSKCRLDQAEAVQERVENGIDESLYKVRQLQMEIVKQLESQHDTLGMNSTDKNLLLFKATALAMRNCLEECTSLIHHPSLLSQQSVVSETTTTNAAPPHVLLNNGQSNNGKTTTDHNNLYPTSTGSDKHSFV